MLKVKVFDEHHEADLEDEVNMFLETISESQFKDIQFQVAMNEDSDGTACSFSAMVIYRVQ